MSETFLQPQSSFYFLENSFRMLSTIQDLKKKPQGIKRQTPLMMSSHTLNCSFVFSQNSPSYWRGVFLWTPARTHPAGDGWILVSPHTQPAGCNADFTPTTSARFNMRVDEKVGQTFCGSINSRSSVGFLRVRAGCALSHVAVMNGHIVPLRGGHLLFFWLAATCEHFAPSAYLVHPQQLERNLSKCFGLIVQREGDFQH